MPVARHTRLALLIGCSLVAATLHAQPAQQSKEEELVIGIPVMPQRGMNAEQVQRLYGEPKQRNAAVGEPPISSWEYDGFVVYFEDEYVLHALAVGNGR